jgi:hypothetical protein
LNGKLKRLANHRLFPIYAGLCMVVQDVLGVLMVQAEARNHGWFAGGADSIQWLFAICTTTITVTALQGHSRRTKINTILCVTAGNLIGSEIGVLIGQRLIK